MSDLLGMSLNDTLYNASSTPFAYPQIDRIDEIKELKRVQSAIIAFESISTEELEMLKLFGMERYITTI